jgi:acyl carrier protein
MTEADVYPLLAGIFLDVFQRDIPLHPELTAKDVDGWDSFKQIEIVIALEERFRFKFTTRELDSLRNVGDLARIVAARAA